MVRTKADGCAATRKVVASRAPRKALGGGGSNSAASSVTASPAANKYAGGNPICPRPTPDWQKGIGNFLKRDPQKEKENEQSDSEEGACASGTSSSTCTNDDSEEAGPSASTESI